MRSNWFGRTAVAAVSLVTLVAAGTSAVADELSKEEAAEVESLIRQYIIDHPEVILDSVRAYSDRQQAAERDRAKQRLGDLQDELAKGPSAGNPDADVTLVEFFDYRCGYCKAALPTIRTILEEDPNLRIVFKEYPILSPESKQAAKAALAAEEQGKYFEFHNALMSSRGSFSDEHIMQVAAEVGLDTERLAERMESPEIQAKLDENMALARQLGITGTPTFVVEDTMVPGAMDLETMQELVAEARAQGAEG